MALAGLAMAGCGSSHRSSASTSASPANHYSPTVQARILRTCKTAAGDVSAAEAPCRCYLTRLEQRISQERLAALERAILDGRVTIPQWLRELATNCAKKL